MVKCQACGASIQDNARSCQYCNSQTEFGRRQDAADAQAERDIERERERARLEQEQQKAERINRTVQESLKRTSKHALLWSLAGLAMCCLPFPSVVGIVMAIRARKMAKKHGEVIPSAATAGLVLSLLGLALAVGFWIFYTLDRKELDAKKASLRASLEQSVGEDALSERTACDLAELRLLEDGFRSHSGTSIKDFECPGKVKQEGELATMGDMFIRVTGEGRVEVKACYKRGSKWIAKGFRMPGGDCSAPPTPEEETREQRKKREKRERPNRRKRSRDR